MKKIRKRPNKVKINLAKPRSKPEKPWVPLQKGHLKPEELLALGMREVWINDHYQVYVAVLPPEDERGGLPMAHLSIKRLDREPIHDWRDLQRIKDELLGTTCEAAELYPADDRLVDGANQYHLWGLPPGRRFPFGFQQRSVTDATPSAKDDLHTAARAAGVDISQAKQRDRKPHHTTVGCPVDGRLGSWWEVKT